MTEVTLSEETIAAIATAVADHLRDRDRHRGLVDAAELARVLGVSRASVYQHADRLGARRLSGKRSRIRFDLDEAIAAWESRPAEKPRPHARRRRAPVRGDLLPINTPTGGS